MNGITTLIDNKTKLEDDIRILLVNFLKENNNVDIDISISQQKVCYPSGAEITTIDVDVKIII